MKKINSVGWIVGLLILTTTLSVCAQKNKVTFRPLTFEEAGALATKENKIVFVDAMRPARTPEAAKEKEKLEKQVFNLPGVADWLENHVIAIRIDMNTPAGKDFAPKLMMNMYPAYGFFMPNGDILNVVNAYSLAKKPETFQGAGEKAWAAALVKKSNSRSITFEEMELKDAMAKAKKENKLIFIDAYTDYCQPCMLMVKNVFSLDKVSDFYNKNFINLKLNFGKEKALAEKYKTIGYPSFLFINGEGKLVHLAGGYTEPDKFIEYAEIALKKAKGIEFTEGSWEQILQQAQKENKLIFMDCYTSWCGPCKQMAKSVFTDPDVATLFNEKLLNVKVDMEKGEGIELKERYGVSAYPTLNFIAPDGKMVHSVVGGLNATEFVEQAEIALSGKGLAYQQQAYQNGNREPAFIASYLNFLDLANLSQTAETVTLDYFATLDKSKLKEKEYWNLFIKYINDVHSDVFQYVYAQRNEFYTLFGEKEVKSKIKTVWAIGSHKFVKQEGDRYVIDTKGFKRYVKELKKTDIEGKEELILSAQMSNAEKVEDWKTYMDLGEIQLNNGKVSDLTLYNWGIRINKKCQDKALRLRASKWFDNAIAKEIEKEKKGEKAMMSYKTYFEKQSAELKK